MTKTKTILIIGLGNPGKDFIKTRHNIGFRIVEYFREKNNFPAWKNVNVLKSKISIDKINENKIILVKPQTFMNNSGQAVIKLLRKFKVLKQNLIVCHDDLDIELGEVKLSQDKKSAGHKGVESIVKLIKTKNFIRIRFGTKPKHQIKNPQKFVLKKFDKEEEKIINILLPKIDQLLLSIIKNGINKTISQYGKLNIKEGN